MRFFFVPHHVFVPLTLQEGILPLSLMRVKMMTRMGNFIIGIRNKLFTNNYLRYFDPFPSNLLGERLIFLISWLSL